MTDIPAPETPALRRRWAARIPLLAAALVIVLVNGHNLARLVVAVAPRHAWESAQVVEGWRSLRGMPVYELGAGRHATHMYGALAPWLQGELFRQMGTSNVAGRVVSLGSALALMTLLALTMRGERTAWLFVLAWAMFLGLNRVAGDYYVENRPDMPALLLSTLALLSLGAGVESRRLPLLLLGMASMVAGFFFKQTAAVVAAVPAVALVLRWRRPSRFDVLSALFPLAAMAAVIVAMKLCRPTVYHYMIRVPSSYSVDPLRVARVARDLVRDSPLFLILLADWIVVDACKLRHDRRMVWLVAAIAVVLPFSAISTAKLGGDNNSKLPALFAIMSFCVLRLPRLLDRLDGTASRVGPRAALGAFLALLLLMTVFPQMSRAEGLFASAGPIDRAYSSAVSLVRTLPGKVVCPEDPTIPVYAKAYAGVSLVAEYDAHPVNHGWPPTHPRSIIDEIEGADYVVDVSGWVADLVREDDLRKLGFEHLEMPALDPGFYRIWHRRSPTEDRQGGRQHTVPHPGPLREEARIDNAVVKGQASKLSPLPPGEG